ncbi:MAG: Pr6Pr family membrane protein [Methyloceanibacter sp.]|nr:Pr6Pr family membrane protein [Methyloceanibacter sp.]
MQLWFRMVAAAIGWFAIALQYYLIVRYKTEGDLVEAAIDLLAFFTMLSNILVALAMTLPWLAPESRLGAFFSRPSVRTAIASYIIVVSAVYYTILRKLWNPEGWQLVADTIEHCVAPALYLIDWLVFVPKGTLRIKSVPWWLIFPVSYTFYSLIHGAVTGYYPYLFLDVTQLGYDRVLLNMAVLTAAFAFLGLVLVGIDRMLGAVEARKPG